MHILEQRLNNCHLTKCGVTAPLNKAHVPLVVGCVDVSQVPAAGTMLSVLVSVLVLPTCSHI